MTTRTRPDPAKTTPEPRPWAEVKARLERHDAAADALRAFLAGEIDVREFEQAFESSTGEHDRTSDGSNWWAACDGCDAALA
jgi:hypothetical protein